MTLVNNSNLKVQRKSEKWQKDQDDHNIIDQLFTNDRKFFQP